MIWHQSVLRAAHHATQVVRHAPLDCITMTDAAALLTEEDVMDALSNVIDPELGLDFVELGLIYGVEIEVAT